MQPSIVRITQNTLTSPEMLEWAIRLVREKHPTVIVPDALPAESFHFLNAGFLYPAWVLGFPIALTTDAHNAPTPPSVFPALRWSRPFILRTRWEELQKAAELMGVPVSSLEEAPCSSYAVRSAVVDAAEWDFTTEALPHHIRRTAIVYGKDTSPLPKAEVYALLAAVQFPRIPQDHTPEDVIILQTKFIPIAEAIGGPPWKDRNPVACVIDKRVLPQSMVDFYVECCERLKIPVLPPDPQQASHFKHILYPMSEHLTLDSAPIEIVKIASAFCLVHTTLKEGNHYPLVCRDFSYARDDELVLHTLNSLATFQEIVENEPLWVLKEYGEFLRRCTYEGVLLNLLGGEMSFLFLKEEER